MGILIRILIGISIVYVLTPKPEDYYKAHSIKKKQQEAAAGVLAQLAASAQGNISKYEIEKLAVQAGISLRELDEKTRQILIERYFTNNNKSFYEKENIKNRKLESSR